MKRKWLAIGIILLFVGSCIVPASALNTEKQTSSRGNIIYVDDDNVDGPWDGTQEHPYQHIQDGVYASENNDTVFVFSGLYFESVSIDKAITLTGENRETTIVDANYTGSPFSFEVSGITINGFTVQHSGTVSYNDAGIQLSRYGHTSSNHTIFNNIIKENWDGLYIIYSFNNHFYNNIIEGNYNNGFFSHSQMYYSKVSNNIIRNNGHYGMYLYSSEFNEIMNNIIENNSILNIILEECIQNVIINNYVAHSKYGIVVYVRSWLNQIISNNITQNEYGIHVYSAQFTLVKKNNFINNTVHAWFLAEAIWSPKTTRWRGNYWSDSVRPVKIEGEKCIVFFNWFDPYGDPFVIRIPWNQYDFFSVKEPYDIPVMR